MNMNDPTEKSIVILLFEHFTALDIIGPYEALSKLKGYRIQFAGRQKTVYRDPKGLELRTHFGLNEISSAEILLVPGGYGIDSILKDTELLQWLRMIDGTTEWTTSVCSGSILLAEAGLLDGRKCTTHWRRIHQLEKYNVSVIKERYVEDGKYITSAGVSAGIDMALYLISRVAGNEAAQMIQLSMEYDPQPPFDCGSPEKAPAKILEKFKTPSGA
jgi:transcriptional regulator GlxA family with amidase domain